MPDLRIRRAKGLKGALRPPSDKSLTHRALLLGASAKSSSEIQMPLESGDSFSTMGCLRELGIEFERSENVLRILPTEWKAPVNELNCGNSGTTMRLLSGMLASKPFTSRLVGDASLSRRPMKRITEPLRKMGAEIEGDFAPFTLKGGDLKGIHHESPVASAQIKSCVLLAGISAEGETSVTEPALSRDHTERMFGALDVPIVRDGLTVKVTRAEPWDGFSFRVPGDISSAAFFLVAACVVPGANVVLEEVNVNPTRTGILDVLKQCGALVTLENERESLGEPVADIRVEFREGLKPFTIAGELVPRLIDEIPVLAVLATQCEGVSVVRDAREMRVKESDRIARMSEGLRKMGVSVEEYEDGFAVEGPVQLQGAVIDSLHDHRIGMAFAIAGLAAQGETVIENAEEIGSSFPTFESALERLVTWE